MQLSSLVVSTKPPLTEKGVANNKELGTELLFIDLVKSEEDFSPTTMYDDYAITEKLFHWQSQNSTRSDSGKGLEYIHHEENNKVILLFLREQKKSEFNSTLGYVFIGKGNLPGTLRIKAHEYHLEARRTYSKLFVERFG